MLELCVRGARLLGLADERLAGSPGGAGDRGASRGHRRVGPLRRAEGQIKVSEPLRWAIEIVVFVGAAAALVVADHVALGAALAMTAVANGAAVRAL